VLSSLFCSRQLDEGEAVFIWQRLLSGGML
jgi:hypothetical protein